MTFTYILQISSCLNNSFLKYDRGIFEMHSFELNAFEVEWNHVFQVILNQWEKKVYSETKNNDKLVKLVYMYDCI